jgi:transcriptional regulator with XRE-family HTH domain
MSSETRPPAEAELIRRYRENTSPALSRRQAAARAGISASQWSDVERGFKKAGGGVLVPVVATAETLARMARVVSANGDDLITAGRQDAADRLTASEREGTIRQRLAAIPGLGAIGPHVLTSADGHELLPLVSSGLDAIENSDLPTATKRDLSALYVDNLIHDAARRHSELLLILRLAAAGTRSS